MFEISTPRYGKEEQKTKLSKKQLALVVLVAILVVGNITFAVLYLTKLVVLRGGVSVMGAIQVYDEDGTTPLIIFSFSNFTPGANSYENKWFFINNTGNQPVYVYWNLTSADTWTEWPSHSGYYHMEASKQKYTFTVRNASDDFWNSSIQGVFLDVDQGANFYFRLYYTGLVSTPEKIEFTVNFHAKDA